MLTTFFIGFPVWPVPLPGPHRIGERDHPVQDRVDLFDDVHAVHHE